MTNDHIPEGAKPKDYHIRIDRIEYTVEQEALTGAQLRQMPKPPVGPDRDLFEVIPGQADRKISDTEVVEIANGERFFTAPAHINPGASGAPGNGGGYHQKERGERRLVNGPAGT